MKKTSLVLAGILVLSSTLVGCGSNVIKSEEINNDKKMVNSTASAENNTMGNTATDAKTLDEAISSYIIDRNVNIYPKSDKQFEVHKIYGTREENGVINVYMHSFYEGYSFVNGKLKAQGGGASPIVITLKKKNNKYTGIQYKGPKSGEVDYDESIKEMFPKEYYEKLTKDSTVHSEINEQMRTKVVAWLKSQGKMEAVLE